MLKIEIIPVTPIEQNCRILYFENYNKCVIVDPGGDADLIINFLETNKLLPEAIWLTHSHFDHCGGVCDLKEKYSCKLYGHKSEKQLRELVEMSALRFGVPDLSMKNCPEPDIYIDDLAKLEFNGLEFIALFTPGHSIGHISFYQKDEKILLGGDAVFQGSIGRTDLPGGNFELLIGSIRSKILTLPDDVKILSGHGPDTSIGFERKSNPFLCNL